MKKNLILLFLLPLIVCASPKVRVKTKHIKPYWHGTVNIEEPSDICLTDTDPSHFYTVSNRGSIAEIDSVAHVLRKTKSNGSDYEAICVKGNMIYAIDESLRRIDVIDPANFSVKKSAFIPFGGGRNKAYEGLIYIPEQKKFIAVVEQPAMIYELNDQLQVINQLQVKQFSELSAVTYHQGYLWFLSDEDHEVMKADATDYHIIDRWSIPIMNPEGIVFNAAGDLLILSDDLATLYKFKQY